VIQPSGLPLRPSHRPLQRQREKVRQQLRLRDVMTMMVARQLQLQQQEELQPRRQHLVAQQQPLQQQTDLGIKSYSFFWCDHIFV